MAPDNWGALEERGQVMNRTHLLAYGAQCRESTLSIYRTLGPTDGQEMARRFLFEVGEAMSDIHGRKDAASILYSVADAITLRLPVEDFRLPAISQAPSNTSVGAPPMSLRARAIDVINHNYSSFLLGLFLGFWAGGAK